MTKPIPSQPNVCKRIFLLSICIFFITNIFAQVGISTTSITPNSSSILELRSTTLGFLPPRMTTTERDAIASPATGLQIYNTTTNLLNFYNGSAWQITGGGSVSSVSITTANGISGTVTNASTTPAISLTLGAITPTSVTASGTITGSNLSGTNTGDQINITGNAATVTTNANLTGEVTSVGNTTTVTNASVIGKVLTGYVSGTGVISATDNILQAIQKLNGNKATNANLTGPITSVGNATSVASQTGTGTTFVMNTSPTIAGINLTAGTTTTAPLKFTSGTNLTTAAAGAMEYDGTNLYFTTGTSNTRKTVALTGSSRIKILPRDFQSTATSGYPVSYDGTGVSVSINTADYMYASIEIPAGYKATAVQIYGNNTVGGATGDYFLVYSSNITTGTLSAALCAATIVGSSVNITNTSANTTNFLVIKIGRSSTLTTTLDTTDSIYGGFITITPI